MNLATHEGQAWLRFWVSIYGENSRLKPLLKKPPVAKPPTVPSAAPRRKIKALEREISEIADHFLGLLLNGEREASTESALIQMRMDHTQGARHLAGVDYHLVDDIATKTEAGGRYVEDDGRYLLPTAQEGTDIFWPIDFAIAARPEDADHYKLGRISTITPREVRGLTKITPARMLLHAHEDMYFDGRPRYSEADIIGMVGGMWLFIEQERQGARHTGSITSDTISVVRTHTADDKKRLTEATNIIFGVRLTERYNWHVAFGAEPGPRMVLPTNPRGCLELFRSRSLPEGRSRRVALRHWVDEHYRERSGDATSLDYVCEHLRGETRFSWNGWPCELMVSELDMENNEYFRARAAQWRSERKHNRVRVRLKGWKDQA